jgi:spoIIIJ-associated protein
MEESKDLKNAVGSFVESLEKEHENNKLVEDNSNKKGYKQSDGFFMLVSKLKKIIEMVCIGEEIRIETDEKNYLISVYGKDLSAIIGSNGQGIEALEQIINLIGKRKQFIEQRIVLDIKDYRKKNIEEVEKLAMNMAEKAVKENKKITLKPMPSYERKIIHNLLSKIEGVKTHSKFDEPNRRIVIYPVTKNSK